MDGDDIRLSEQLVLRDERGADFAARSVVRFWLQAITFIPKALPIRATAPPTLPSPRSPRVRPSMSSPTDCCHPPPRSDVFSAMRLRALARISAQVSSIVGVEV